VCSAGEVISEPILHVEVFFLQGYLKSLGMKRTAEVKKDARLGEAEASRDSGIKVKI
jgi:uncharacterized membrane protein YqiK